MKKRGSGHLEMIIAFVIFISAVVFVLTYFNPLNAQNPKITDESFLLEKIEEPLSTSSNLSIALVLFNPATPADYKLSVKLPQGTVNGEVLVKTSNNTILKAREDSFTGDLVNFDWNINNLPIIYIYTGPGITDSTIAPSGIDGSSESPPSQVILSSLSEIDYIPYENLTNIQDQYNDDYASLKSSLGSFLGDFSFELISNDGLETIKPNNPLKPSDDQEVHIASKNINVLKDNEFKIYNLKVSAW
jgi:hypothetical protein